MKICNMKICNDMFMLPKELDSELHSVKLEITICR